VLCVKEANASGLEAFDLLVAGPPTHGAKPSLGMQAQIGARAPEGVKVAAFDTRLTIKLITMFGTAAPKVAKTRVEKGGTRVGRPIGLYVKGGEGPLEDGEAERAAAWVKGLAES
jgi:flavodoxin I